ncbi:hypothetical protein O6H91_16G069500 [Diphasiastrum complanatum]|uniref:Uncharacterized protein n=1 Tax=Diphasiastrum complanatum TaxID=34168 RepID=A0ACC2BDG8_DIPCM|nr:hypothetical protein O6H91_16G069500 [Diphasiastrum complanatum]
MAAAGGRGGGIGLCWNPHPPHFFFFYSDPSPSQFLALWSAPSRIPITLLITNNYASSSCSNSINPTRLLPSSSACSCRPMAAESSMTNALEEQHKAYRVERLWQQFFLDPSKWWDKRFDKGNSEAPDFKHKTTEKALWINDRFSPSWLQSKLATLHRQPPQQLSSPSSSTTASSSIECVGEAEIFVRTCPASRTTQLWEEFFSEPSQWWDNRKDKRNLRSPDFKHKTAKKALWIDSTFNPPWVHARLAAMTQYQVQRQLSCSTPEISGRVVRTEQLWQEFFSDPSQWLDSRFIKKSPKYPDFKHKSTHEGLWIEGGLNPPWVKAKMATVALFQQQSGGGLRSRVPDSFCNCDNVSKLCQEGRLTEALHVLELMVQQNTRVPVKAYVGLLKGFARRKALAEGKRVHALLVQSGLDSDIFLANTLVDMYAKCGDVLDARKVFNTMPEHNVFSWTAIISAYADHGQGKEAINLFQQMQQTGIAPDKVAFVAVLKACARIAALEQGKQLHSDIIKSGFESDLVIGNILVDMYAKCGCIEHARQAFNKMSERDVISWSAMIAGYAQIGLAKEALTLYEKMKQEGVQPNNVTYVILLKACASIAGLEQGKRLHSDIIRSGFESDMFVGNILIDMYAKCGCIEHACQVFNKMSERDMVSWNSMIAGYVKCGRMEDARELFNNTNERDVVSWNAMIAGYAQNELDKEALALYEQMKEEGMLPDNVTYVILLKACASIAALEQGKQLHSDIIRSGFESDVTVGNTLIDMYAKCVCIEYACQVFNKMRERDVVSWSAMISGYAQNGLDKEALALYEQMKHEGMQPNSVTYVILLKVCASIGALEQGKQLHSDITKSGFQPDVVLGNTLVDMYAKCGCIEHARRMFNQMSERDVVSWSAMIAGYVQNGLGKEALALYKKMKEEGVQPDNVTYVILLKACASVAALEQGKQLHTHIIKNGLELDVIVSSALVDMYAKCGSIEHACQVFNNMHERDVVSWNAMIAGCAQQGLGKEVLALLEQMQREGKKPNEVTYISVLSACSHCGLVDEGRQLFDAMCKDHAVIPTMDHYACMVDLLGRAGYLAEAEDFVNRMPIQPDAVVWRTLLGAARNHGHVEIGRRAFHCVVKFEPKNAAAYVLLSQMYAAVGRLDEVAKIRKEMTNVGVNKVPGLD